MKTRKPAWWQLYMLVPIMIVLSVLEHIAPLPGVSDEVVDIGIVLFTFGAMLVWVHLNGGLLEQFEVDKDASYYDLKITVYEPDPKAREDGEAFDNVTQYAMSRSMPRVRGERSILLKEEDKWLLN